MAAPMDVTLRLGPRPEADPIGREVDGFRVLSLLGAGGMGRVYKALDTRLRRTVAIKMIAPSAADDPEHFARFEREVQALSAVAHPNVAQIYSSGVYQGLPYYAMEHVDGQPLSAALEEGRHLSGRRCLDHLIAAARGLEAALENGIVHRDIKPGNLMVDGAGRLKIVDFGLARSLLDDGSLTLTGHLIGTPLYISPEQAQGAPVDHRADIYSLGATFYHLLGGEPPFGADTPLALAMHHVRSPLTPLRERNPRVPATVAAVIETMLAKDPAARYQSYPELIADLERAKAGIAVLASSSPGTARSPARAAAGSRPARRGDDRYLAFGLLSAAVLAALIVVGLLAWRSPESGAEPRVEEPASGLSPAAHGASREPASRQPSVPTSSSESEPPPRLDPATLVRHAHAVGSMAHMRKVSTAIEVYLAENGALPADLAAVAAAYELRPRERLDAWKREIRYEPGDGEAYRLVSAGADGVFGSEDDLVFEDGFFANEPELAIPGLE